ncbi:MAG: hypothetical protein PF483_01635 [Halothiobacillus sp.]|jgi:hypothetical protein|nr:hypothetical protein [Halothiobacillus sp.]
MTKRDHTQSAIYQQAQVEIAAAETQPDNTDNTGSDAPERESQASVLVRFVDERSE